MIIYCLQIFDVKCEENPINIAYSNAVLDFHMDLVYYESPPGLQLLHCVRWVWSTGDSTVAKDFHGNDKNDSTSPIMYIHALLRERKYEVMHVWM